MKAPFILEREKGDNSINSIKTIPAAFKAMCILIFACSAGVWKQKIYLFILNINEFCYHKAKALLSQFLTNNWTEGSLGRRFRPNSVDINSLKTCCFLSIFNHSSSQAGSRIRSEYTYYCIKFLLAFVRVHRKMK